MKAIFAILFVLSPIVSAAEKPENLLQTKVSFNGLQVRVADIFAELGDRLKTPPNIVFKNDAGNHEVSSLLVKDVTLGNLFRVLTTTGVCGAISWFAGRGSREANPDSLR